RRGRGDCGSGVRGLNEPGGAVGEVRCQADARAQNLHTLARDVGQVDQEMSKFLTLRRDRDETAHTAGDLGARLVQIEESRPVIAAALGELAQLSGVRATIKEALEQTQLTHGEIGRVRESLSGTRPGL